MSPSTAVLMSLAKIEWAAISFPCTPPSFLLFTMTSTVRIFVNNNRISTAVRLKTGSILQVYPAKRNFASEEEWQKHWEVNLRPKLVLRWSDSDSDDSPAPPPPAPAPPAPRRLGTDKSNLGEAPKKAKLSDWNFTQKDKIVKSLPPGEYYIGDLCYVLGDNIYDNIFGGTGYESGIYEEKGTGRVFLVNSTAYGDGLYVGSDGKEFAVDAGIIGICSKSLMAKDDGGGHVYTFRHPVGCRLHGGKFTFTDGSFYIDINTDGWDENDEDNY
jgi:hypothetical protein